MWSSVRKDSVEKKSQACLPLDKALNRTPPSLRTGGEAEQFYQSWWPSLRRHETEPKLKRMNK